MLALIYITFSLTSYLFIQHSCIAETSVRPYSKVFRVCIPVYECHAMAVAEVVRFTSNLAQLFICYVLSAVQFLVYTSQIAQVQGQTKISQYFTLSGGKCVCISPASVWHDSGRRNNLIHLKFRTNVYVLCEISCIIFGICCSNNVYKGVPESISMHYSLWRKII